MPIRLDKLVAEKFGLSRRAAQDAVRNGRIDLAGERCDEPGREVEPDAAVEFFPNRPKARTVAGRLKVLHQDPYVLVVDKPAGLLTLPTPDRERDTLVERVRRYLMLRHGDQRPFVGVVHRLDKDTSGALALARSPDAVRAFQALFKAHDIERQYLAIVEGTPSRSEGTIDLALVTDRGDLRRGVAREAGEGRRAVTHYRVVERFGPVGALVACWLETGRTHQIRIHLAEIGHPVVGDAVYRPRGLKRSKAQFHRQALHAQTLGFRHPLTGQDVRVEAPLPTDMAELVVDLRNRYGIPGAGG
ncbi:MAG: RluA family pseudouridine synthase [Isosphaeraceae bacterium]|nr:RluA family pseudouridine synthase [Isosphaeraceae bacterium]